MVSGLVLGAAAWIWQQFLSFSLPHPMTLIIPTLYQTWPIDCYIVNNVDLYWSYSTKSIVWTDSNITSFCDELSVAERTCWLGYFIIIMDERTFIVPIRSCLTWWNSSSNDWWLSWQRLGKGNDGFHCHHLQWCSHIPQYQAKQYSLCNLTVVSTYHCATWMRALYLGKDLGLVNAMVSGEGFFIAHSSSTQKRQTRKHLGLPFHSAFHTRTQW